MHPTFCKHLLSGTVLSIRDGELNQPVSACESSQSSEEKSRANTQITLQRGILEDRKNHVLWKCQLCLGVWRDSKLPAQYSSPISSMWTESLFLLGVAMYSAENVPIPASTRERWPEDTSGQWDMSRNYWQRLWGKLLKRRKVDLSGTCLLPFPFFLPAGVWC